MATKSEKKSKFNFDVNVISLKDLSEFFAYYNMKIDPKYSIETIEEFIAYWEEDYDYYHKLLYLASLLAHNCVKIETETIIRMNGKEVPFEILCYNQTIEFELDGSDYDGFNDMGDICLEATIREHNLWKFIPMLSKYPFITKREK